MSKYDPEVAAMARAMQFDEEGDDIEAFLAAYPRATGEILELVDLDDAPDAICRRPGGAIIGVEHTRIRRSPDDARWDAIIDKRDEMQIDDTFDEIGRLIFQKAERRKKFSTARTILLIAIYESDFEIATRLASGIPLEDLADTGFEEIWLADFKGIREGAHRESGCSDCSPTTTARSPAGAGSTRSLTADRRRRSSLSPFAVPHV